MARRTFAALIAVVALLVVGGTVVAAETGTQQLDEPAMNNTDTAQEAYVTEDGDVILVYEDNETSEGSGHFGLNVTEGLVYGLYEMPDLDSNVTGSFSMAADRSKVNGSGSLSAPRPDELESLDFEIDSVTSPSEARSDVTLDTSIALPEDSAMIAAVFSNAQTNGEITTTGTTLSTSGNAEWTMTLPGTSAQSYDYDLRASDGGHVLEVQREGQVSEREASMWDTREKASERIRRQFEGMTSSVGGSSEVTIESYSFEETDTGGQLTLAYTVEIEGLNELLRQSIATGMSGPMGTGAASSFGPNQDEISEDLSNLSIERASISFETGSDGGSADWNISVENYGGLMKGYFAAMETVDESGFVANQSERYEEQLAAMNAADYTGTFSWDAMVETTSDGAIVANVSLQQRSENWEAYVSERDERGLPPVGTQEFTMNVLSEGDRVRADGSFLIQQEDLYNRTIENYEQSLQAGGIATPSAEQAIATIKQLGFRGARLDASVNESTATIEGGAAFDNLSAAVEYFDIPGNASVERAYMSQDADGSQGHVRMNDAVDAVDESTVRQLEFVSEGTTLHMPGDWDADSRSFESLNTQKVRSYIPNAANDGSANDDGMSTELLVGGVGALAVVGALGGVVLRRRT
ncbi:PGF-CTERM sorting domain-containing protein [Halorhabdus amylolytica]|uniref:PGF-CTERM sorting domain-containing protein n=1 Tax=Halorhabdus amylolytica TaxID=2559573 RepID=UPI0010A99EAB|nr:PGF-CTERM sorting domain-containing protein [Halorhabdus amylolytica]